MRYVDGTDIDMFAKLQKIYADESAQIQRDLFAFVTKYADDNKMSYSDALQRLRGVDLSEIIKRTLRSIVSRPKITQIC